MEAVNKILLVDDVDMNLVILSQIVEEMNFVPLSASSATEALEVLRNDLPQLILLDVSMPDMSAPARRSTPCSRSLSLALYMESLTTASLQPIMTLY